MDQLNELVTSGRLAELLLPWVIKIGLAALIFVVGRWLAKMVTNGVDRVMKKAGVDATLIHFLHNVIYAALLIAVIIAAVDQVGVNTTSFLAILGAAGLAVGLALQSSLSNFSSGIMLILFRPFKTGDFIEAGGTLGTVEQINVFNTVMKTGDNREIIVPNAQIFSGTITNFSARATRRIDLIIGIGYDDNIAKAKQIVEDILSADERILKEPAPVILVMELGASSVDLAVRPWVRREDYAATRSDLLENIKTGLEDGGCSIPYPQQDIHLYRVGD
ncbi:MAG: mechanosensitive ion channel [Gammaproteobacteria bacterium]|nr:mechanosensitive ion channel [Gammaproteobacteria bacterium]MCZ6911274.1 mechanosensitive ion channel [Pseudomonadota bacterium]